MTCRAFEQFSSRRENLTFNHHLRIVPLKTTNSQLAEEILDWCEEPVKQGKKPRSIAKMLVEIKRRQNKHFTPLVRARVPKKDFIYIEFMGPIELLADHNEFDIKALAKIQVDLFGKGDMLKEDLAACSKVAVIIDAFLKEVNFLCSMPKNG
jgi:hypothetical protein